MTAGIVHIDIGPCTHGFHQACRSALARLDPAATRTPGALAEYPSRVEHARARRRHTALRRRDRRRARTGRPALASTRRPARLRTPEFTNALAGLSAAFTQVGQAAALMSRGLGEAGARVVSDAPQLQERLEQSLMESFVQHQPVIETNVLPEWLDIDAICRMYDETDQSATERTAAFRRLAAVWPRRRAIRGAVPASTIYDDVMAYRRSVYRQFASGGLIGPPRAADDDSIPVRISPGEVWAGPEAVRRYGPLLQALNRPGSPLGPGRIRVVPPTRDVTHYDRYLGEGALERDETSSIHSTDSSGTGAVWSDLMARIDDLVDGEE
jgi:hypothetical protein